MKNTKNCVRTSTPTLTQSGLLAVLLQRQRHKAIKLAQHRTRRPEHGRSLIQNCWRMLHGAAASRLFRRGVGETLPRHP
jgi:hypothetical protein